MRAVVWGLVGAVLAVGAAQATETPMANTPASCPAERAVMRLEVRHGSTVYDMAPEHPEWAGREYRVTSARSNLALRQDPRGAGRARLGYDAALTLNGPGGPIKVATLHTRGTPAVQDVSTNGEFSEFGPLTRRVQSVPPVYHLLGGPLAGFDLLLARCEPPERQASR